MGRKKKDQPPAPPPSQSPGVPRRRGRPIPLWQKALLAVSVVLMLGGGAAWAYAMVTRPAPAAPGDAGTPRPGGSAIQPDGLVQGFAPGAGGGGQSPAGAAPAGERSIDLYSPAVFRLGFSFFAGFAMAYAVRQFVKMTVVVVGVVLLGLFGLQYAGLVKVDWGAIEGRYDSMAAFLRDQTASFTKFVSGYLPSATSAAAGAVVGFRRK